ncbi:hypothetical protein [Planobispora longispora]|uniref:Uncharacterized protein n=1 Tax=Planobispora longispora TaxID=28887 RepID=A0A8J3RTU7_9ACTN|nr:hypothetical protein [Planobispora longispora]GIH81089.1 hypothetical protein Plo01_75180 [Planobispora longispora]
MTMDVRYNPVLGWMFIVLGGIGAVLQIWLLLLGTFTVFIIFSIFFLIVGFLSLRRTFFSVYPGGVTTYAMIGPAKRDFLVDDRQTLALEGGRLVLRMANGKRKSVANRAMSHPDDWKALVAAMGR